MESSGQGFGPVTPLFPGGRETAPELTPGGCANPACLCAVPVGRTYCCGACVRAADEGLDCGCGHFGCSHRTF